MHLFWSDRFSGVLKDCNEGVREWLDKQELLQKNIWQGDKIFLRLLDEHAPFFSLKLEYRGDSLQRAVLNGAQLPL